MSLRDPELVGLFLIEGRDLVDRATGDLAALQATPGDAARIDELFRALHTLKGSTAIFELAGLTRMLHAAETLLEQARRDGQLLDASRLLDVFDLAEQWMDNLEVERQPAAELIERTSALTEALGGRGSLDEDNENPARDSAWASTLVRDLNISGALVAVRYRPGVDAYFRGDDPLAIVRALPSLVKLDILTETSADDAYDPFRCSLQIDAVCAAPLLDVKAALKWVGDEALVATVESGRSRPAVSGQRSVRIDAARVDAMAAMVDELVIAKNALLHEVMRLADLAQDAGRARDLANARAAMDRVVGDLHAGINDLRLVEIGRVFGRFPRQVREIGESLGKRVDFESNGGTVSLDKAVVEGLYEPLLHLVRNALDHGVESSDARRAAGKSADATLSLAARSLGGGVVIEVTDDGRGLDVDRIRRTAIARGVVKAATAEQMSDADLAELIFAPGFSTAEAVSDLSGRGVGMDAVRTSVERLGGRVSLENRPGLGLTVRLTLPARVMLTRVLTVSAGGERFGVSMDTVTELHRVTGDEISSLRMSRAYVRRDTVLPLLRLADLLKLPAGPDPPSFPVLSIRAADTSVGVQVDALGDRFQAPLRPLTGLLAGYPGVLGTVVEGDGRVLLILDLLELAS